MFQRVLYRIPAAGYHVRRGMHKKGNCKDMKVRIDDNCPHRMWVTSEEDGSREYCVELGKYPVGLNEHGVMVYNGACIMTSDPNAEKHELGMHGCKDFIYRCEPKLKKPENMGKVFRCKHCRAAREFALDFIVPHLLKIDPNIDEDYQT